MVWSQWGFTKAKASEDLNGPPVQDQQNGHSVHHAIVTPKTPFFAMIGTPDYRTRTLYYHKVTEDWQSPNGSPRNTFVKFQDQMDAREFEAAAECKPPNEEIIPLHQKSQDNDVEDTDFTNLEAQRDAEDVDESNKQPRNNETVDLQLAEDEEDVDDTGLTNMEAQRDAEDIEEPRNDENPHLQLEEDEEDVDEADCQLSKEEFDGLTQELSQMFGEEDENDVPLRPPPPTYYSQPCMSQNECEENTEGPKMERAQKRARPNREQDCAPLKYLPQPLLEATAQYSNARNRKFFHQTMGEGIAPVISSERKDTEDTWNLIVDGQWMVFKKEEQYYSDSTFGYLRMVYTIKGFFNDPKGKMAICHAAIRARDSWLGTDFDEFDEKKFTEKFGSKFISCHKSQNLPLRKLKRLEGSKFQKCVDFPDPSKLKVHVDLLEPKTTGSGWSVGFSFDALFSNFGALEPFNAVDFFAGAGGMSSGLENAGFRLTHAVENDQIVTETLKLNHPDANVFHQDVGSFLDEAEQSNKKKGPYNCAMVVHAHFSSPCQGFSTMNTSNTKKNREKKEAFNKLSLTFPQGVIRLRVPTGSFENVTGMLSKKKGHIRYIKKIMFMFLMNDYQVRVGVADSSSYGDPQKRQRVFILVSKYGWALPNFPEPTHGPGTMNPLRTPRDAIGDLEQVEPRDSPGLLQLEKPWRGLFPKEASDSGVAALVVDHHVRSHDGDHPSQKTYDKSDMLMPDKPANTVLCGHAIRHYSLDRALTNLEAARLQSFADHWKFAGSAKQVQKQIGNAVPVGLATAIAKECYKVHKI